jgi:hypothetical protein
MECVNVLCEVPPKKSLSDIDSATGEVKQSNLPVQMTSLDMSLSTTAVRLSQNVQSDDVL